MYVLRWLLIIKLKYDEIIDNVIDTIANLITIYLAFIEGRITGTPLTGCCYSNISASCRETVGGIPSIGIAGLVYYSSIDGIIT